MRNRRQGERASLKEAPSTPGIRDFWFQDGNPEALRRYPDMPTTRRYGARITRWCAALGKSRPSDRGSITAECRAERLSSEVLGAGRSDSSRFRAERLQQGKTSTLQDIASQPDQGRGHDGHIGDDDRHPTRRRPCSPHDHRVPASWQPIRLRQWSALPAQSRIRSR